MAQAEAAYPVQLSVDYPDRALNCLATLFRPFTVIPIAIVAWAITAGAGGTLAGAPLLMILFRKKYPKWWFDWNLALSRFNSRISAYMLLLRDEYPSTDEEQAVHLEIAYPDVERDLNRWLPLVKWLLAIPHYIVLIFLFIGVVVVVIISWFAILFTGRYPRDVFGFVVGVMRWASRVNAYALLLVTDRYPAFRLGP